MKTRLHQILALTGGLLATFNLLAAVGYWNVFNIEGESDINADIVTYDTLEDMLTDSNRTGVFSPDTPGFGDNVVGSGSDGVTYWNVFNIEGESDINADIVTYDTLEDMLTDSNRTGVFSPDTLGFGDNVVGSGSGISRAEFQVSKEFSDNNPTAVMMTLNCSSGIVSEPVQVSEGNPQSLTVIAFNTGNYGSTDCTVIESGLPVDYYQLSASEGCQVNEVEDDGVYVCEIINAALFSVPTLSHYGLILLWIIMLSLGFVAHRRLATR